MDLSHGGTVAYKRAVFLNRSINIDKNIVKYLHVYTSTFCIAADCPDGGVLVPGFPVGAGLPINFSFCSFVAFLGTSSAFHQTKGIPYIFTNITLH